MKQLIKKASTSKRMAIFVADSSSTTGAGLTGLTYSSAGLKWYYWREDAGNAGGTAVTLATATRGTWTSGGFKEIDSTNLPGWYEIGIPDAVLASGAYWVSMMLFGATNMAPCPLEIQLVTFDPTDGNLGLTGLGGLTAPTAGALITSGTGTAQLSVSSGRAQADTTAIAGATGAASALGNFFNAVKSLTVDTSTFTPSTTVMEFTNTTNADYYTGRLLTFYGASSGSLAGSIHQVTAYTYSANNKVKLTISPALPAAPADGATLGIFAGSGSNSLTAADVRVEIDANSVELAAIKTLTDHLATALELHSGNYRFTADALANAPTGSGGGLDAAGVRSAIGLASANLDTQLGTIYGKIDTEVAAIQAKTDLIGTSGVLADGGITTAKFATGAIDASVIATDAFGALELAAGAASEIATAVATALGIGGTITELTGPIDTSAANLGQLVMSLAMVANNKVESDRDGNLTVYNAAGSAVWTQTATTDGATIAKGKAEAP